MNRSADYVIVDDHHVPQESLTDDQKKQVNEWWNDFLRHLNTSVIVPDGIEVRAEVFAGWEERK